mgnify:CR=1 FL=1
MSQVKATFLLPVQSNEGRALAEELEEVERACFIAFGAFTFSGYIKGTWRMETGERKQDTSALYWIIMDETDLPQLEKILMHFKKRAGQEAIYLEIERHVDVRFL